MMALNYPQVSGEGRRVSMDGMTSELTPTGFDRAHHDFTVLPDNGLAIIVYNGAGSSACSGIIERSSTGTITNIVQDVSSIYRPSSQGCHPNSIHYHASSQTYTVSDRFVNLYVKIRRYGQLIWQFGGTNPFGSSFTGVTAWQVNHGHSMLADGTFLFFNNGSSGASTALSYMLNETSMVATKNSWQYRPGITSSTLGDVQRLPNGNTLVTFSTPGNGNPRPLSEIHEVTPAGTLVQKITGPSFGYAEFRKSLYGPPLR